MEKKIISILTTISVKDLSLIPLMEVSLKYNWRGNFLSLSGVIQPFAVLIVSRKYEKVLMTTGKEFSLEQFIKEFPEMKKVLEGYLTNTI